MALWTLCTKLYARAYTGGSTPGAARSGGTGASTVRPFLFLVDMPSWPLVRLLIKIAIASIPAGIVIAFIYMVLVCIYGAVLCATHHTNLLR